MLLLLLLLEDEDTRKDPNTLRTVVRLFFSYIIIIHDNKSGGFVSPCLLTHALDKHTPYPQWPSMDDDDDDDDVAVVVVDDDDYDDDCNGPVWVSTTLVATVLDVGVVVVVVIIIIEPSWRIKS
jgi:hypothetical protein